MIEMENGICVPRCAEIVMLGKLTPEQDEEGPFVDITGTYDLIRQQPVLKITKILRQKKNPIYYALIPGRGEHSFLMGFGKLPLIFKELNKICKLKDLAFTDGNINWLGCSVSIEKLSDDEPKKIIETLLKDRELYYKEADLIIDQNNGDSVDEIVKIIHRKIKRLK